MGVGLGFSAVQFQHVSEIRRHSYLPGSGTVRKGPKFKKSGSPIRSAHSCPHLNQSCFLHMQDPVFLKRLWFKRAVHTPTNVTDACRPFPRQVPDDDDLNLPKNTFQRIFSEHCETGYWKRQSPTCLPRCSIAAPPSAVQ